MVFYIPDSFQLKYLLYSKSPPPFFFFPMHQETGVPHKFESSKLLMISVGFSQVVVAALAQCLFLAVICTAYTTGDDVAP